METIIIRPAVETSGSFQLQKLEKLFETKKLIDKTVCEDRIIYVFTNKDN